ncbi:MAG: acetyl-CoA carboxylase biotin carboxyl carrier protein [Candidatus Marinimicrobia bacterium]|nr:acetyl-CoA carboxylase biotin carboxyl carrier protein [Candidatus Neomarinimicrobiota bacterium]
MQKSKLKELIAIVEESGINEIEVSTWWGRKVRITKNSNAPGAYHQPPAIAVPGAASANQPEASPAAEPPVVSSDHHTILSPIVGTFYRAPSPESPAFINVGDKLTKGQTICIIEAMKIMNEIESEVSGTVVEILVENANPVEFNQALVVVDPG